MANYRYSQPFYCWRKTSKGFRGPVLVIGEIQRQDSSLLALFFEGMDKIVEKKHSLIADAGMGLFAKKNMKSGRLLQSLASILSMLLASILGIPLSVSHPATCGNAIFWRDASSDANNSEDSVWNGNYLQCIIGSCPLAGLCVSEVFGGDSLFVDVDPSQVDRVGWKGHYVNDGAVVEACEEASYHSQLLCPNLKSLHYMIGFLSRTYRMLIVLAL